MLNCPTCGSDYVIKNGKTRHGKQNHKCRSCGRQFVLEPQNQPISKETLQWIDRILLERVSLAGICCVTGVSHSFLQNYVNQKYRLTSRKMNVRAKKTGRLTVQCDELWSFVGFKGRKIWVWITLDIDTREVIAAYIGKRGKKAVKRLWKQLPPVYRQCAVCFTDFYESYVGVLPSKRHKPVAKASGKTNAIERLNNTLRQRISRFVRKTLSFSKSLENHIGATFYFSPSL